MNLPVNAAKFPCPWGASLFLLTSSYFVDSIFNMGGLIFIFCFLVTSRVGMEDTALVLLFCAVAIEQQPYLFSLFIVFLRSNRSLNMKWNLTMCRRQRRRNADDRDLPPWPRELGGHLR